MSLNAQQPPQTQAPKPERTIVPVMVDEKYGTAEQIMALPPGKLVAILKDPKASPYAKAKACQRLAVSGDKAAVPALAALLADSQLSHYARYALEPMPDPAADEALRSALGKVKGRLLVGVINSLGQRKDARSVEALGKLLNDPDREVAEAASAALARIRPPL
jgi:HEAT repeat protein